MKLLLNIAQVTCCRLCKRHVFSVIEPTPYCPQMDEMVLLEFYKKSVWKRKCIKSISTCLFSAFGTPQVLQCGS